MMNNPTDMITFSPARSGGSRQVAPERSSSERDLFRQMVESARERRDRRPDAGAVSRQSASAESASKKSVQENASDTENKPAGTALSEGERLDVKKEQGTETGNRSDESGETADATAGEENPEAPLTEDSDGLAARQTGQQEKEEVVADENQAGEYEQVEEETDEDGQSLDVAGRNHRDGVIPSKTADAIEMVASEEGATERKSASGEGREDQSREAPGNSQRTGERTASATEHRSVDTSTGSDSLREVTGKGSEGDKLSDSTQQQKSSEKQPIDKKVLQDRIGTASPSVNQQDSQVAENNPDRGRMLEAKTNSRVQGLRDSAGNSVLGRSERKAEGVRVEQGREPAEASGQTERLGFADNTDSRQKARIIQLQEGHSKVPAGEAGLAISGDLMQKAGEALRANRREQLRDERQVNHLQAFASRLQPESRPVRFNSSGGLSGELNESHDFHFSFGEGSAGMEEEDDEITGKAKALWREHLTEFDEVSESRSPDASAAGTTRLGQVTIANISIRKHVLGPLSQAVQQTAGGEKSQGESWQKHSFVLDDGKKIDLMAKRVDGVLQLKLSSSNQELNRLLMQHQQEIRQHLERECGLQVDLQFDRDGESSTEQAFEEALSGSNRQKERITANHEGPGLEPEHSTRPDTIRSFGYNRMEWTA